MFGWFHTLGTEKEPDKAKAHVNSQGQTIVSPKELLKSEEVQAFMKKMNPKVNEWIRNARQDKGETPKQ